MKSGQKQPAVAYLGTSIKTCFPFVLVFGREYNNDSGNRIAGLGPYCLPTTSTFWNRTYTLFGKMSKCSGLRGKCRSLNQSPILFSNVFPRPIRNAISTAKKRQERSAVRSSKIDRHIRHVFSMKRIFQVTRVAVVVLSGLEDKRFEYGVKQIAMECKKRKIPVLSIPYLGSRKGNKFIEAGISPQDRKQIRGVIEAFTESA